LYYAYAPKGASNGTAIFLADGFYKQRKAYKRRMPFAAQALEGCNPVGRLRPS